MSEYIDDSINLSDHKPLLIVIDWLVSFASSNISEIDCDKLISLPQNFDNDEIKEKFNGLLFEQLENYINLPIIDNNNKQEIINAMYSQLSSSINSAYKQ